MKELMIYVERIVRPIRADWSKLRIRRELLAHLQAAFNEERDRGLDDAAALVEAKRRLGEPAVLTRELQASISRLEQLAVTPFPGSISTAFIVASILIPIVLAVASSPALIGSHHARLTFVAGVVVMELNALLLYEFSIGFIRSKVRWGRITWAGFTAVFAQVGWISLITFSLTGRAIPNDVADTVFELFALPAFCATMGVAAVLGSLLTKQWRELDIAA